jgi:hypothetical protein
MFEITVLYPKIAGTSVVGLAAAGHGFASVLPATPETGALRGQSTVPLVVVPVFHGPPAPVNVCADSQEAIPKRQKIVNNLIFMRLSFGLN